MSRTTAEKKYYTVKSSDHEAFEVEESVAMMSQTLKNIIEDGCTGDGIPLPNVTGNILAQVIEYCKKHAGSSPKTAAVDGGHGSSSSSSGSRGGAGGSEELKNWDKQFVDVDMDTLYDLIMAANYLNISGLLDMMCQTVADMIKGKTPEEIRRKFNIKNDFTPEEEEEVRMENTWAFE